MDRYDVRSKSPGVFAIHTSSRHRCNRCTQRDDPIVWYLQPMQYFTSLSRGKASWCSDHDGGGCRTSVKPSLPIVSYDGHRHLSINLFIYLRCLPLFDIYPLQGSLDEAARTMVKRGL
eukprot:scaffold836_cov189-Alexandrium_tamarense.AAC.14